MSSSPWYSSVAGEVLEQGDLFYGFPVLVPELTSEDILMYLSGTDLSEIDQKASIKLLDVVVMTQSCDLENNKIETVMLCPIWSLDDFKPYLGRAKRNNIRKGNMNEYHLLNSSEELGISFTLVEFSRLYMTSKDALIEFAKSVESRPRLNPPYKEHLSQAFARYFMRVGLPSNIPEF